MDIGNLFNKVIQNNQKTFIHFGVVTARTSGNTRISVQVSGATTASWRHRPDGFRTIGS